MQRDTDFIQIEISIFVSVKYFWDAYIICAFIYDFSLCDFIKNDIRNCEESEFTEIAS